MVRSNGDRSIGLVEVMSCTVKLLPVFREADAPSCGKHAIGLSFGLETQLYDS